MELCQETGDLSQLHLPCLGVEEKVSGGHTKLWTPSGTPVGEKEELCLCLSVSLPLPLSPSLSLSYNKPSSPPIMMLSYHFELCHYSNIISVKNFGVSPKLHPLTLLQTEVGGVVEQSTSITVVTCPLFKHTHIAYGG